MDNEYTPNGVRYKSDLAGPDGASFIVYKDKKTLAQAREAIKYLRSNRDVVYIRIANKYDLIDDYWSKMFRVASIKYKLHWSQIERDEGLLFKALSSGVSPSAYAKKYYKEWRKTN